MEELIVDKQKKIINKIVTELGSSEVDLYYTDSSTIANLIVEKIKEHKLPRHELDIVKDLNYQDVLILMSYNSNCC